MGIVCIYLKLKMELYMSAKQLTPTWTVLIPYGKLKCNFIPIVILLFHGLALC